MVVAAGGRSERLAPLVARTFLATFSPARSAFAEASFPSALPGPTRLAVDAMRQSLIAPLARHGVALLHGACFEVGSALVTAVGRSGGGKTTLAIAALAAGGRVVSDDSLLLFRSGREVHVRAARRDLLLRPGSRVLLPPRLRDRLRPTAVAGERRWRLARDDARRRFRAGGVSSVLLVLEGPSRFPETTRLRLLTEAGRFAALTAHSSPALLSPDRPVESRRLVALYAHAAARFDGYAVTPGRDLFRDPGRVLAGLLRT